MNAAQRTALENLLGRPLTAAEVTNLTPLVTQRNDVALALGLSVGRMAVQGKIIGLSEVLASLDPTGGAFLDQLASTGQTNRNVFWMLELIKAGKFDIGLPSSRTQFQALATSTPAIASALTTLLAIAERPEAITTDAVSKALNVA